MSWSNINLHPGNNMGETSWYPCVCSLLSYYLIENTRCSRIPHWRSMTYLSSLLSAAVYLDALVYGCLVLIRQSVLVTSWQCTVMVPSAFFKCRSNYVGQICVSKVNRYDQVIILHIFSSARYGLSASSDLSQYIGPTKERKVPNLQFWSPWRKFIVYHSSCVLFYDRYSKPDFFYIKSWVPCIFFSGGVTIGTIGRALAMVSWDYRPVCIGSYNNPTG